MFAVNLTMKLALVKLPADHVPPQVSLVPPKLIFDEVVDKSPVDLAVVNVLPAFPERSTLNALGLLFVLDAYALRFT